MRKQDNYIEIGIQCLEWFKQLAGFTDEQLLDYMNKNNAWEMLNEKDIMLGCMWLDMESIVYIFGRYLTEDERQGIIKENSEVD